MNQILLYKTDFIDDNIVELNDRRLEHISNIHKAEINDTLKVGLINNKQGTGKIIELSEHRIKLEVNLDSEPPAPLPVTLVMALPRPNTLKKVLQCVTAMGVKQIYLIRTRRVEKSYWQSPLLEEENIHKHLVLGLEQARDTIVPEIHMRKFFKPFVSDELPSIIQNSSPLVAHPLAQSDCPADREKPVTLAIGPEGGFIDFEIDLLKSIGFHDFSIGPRILRVEHAIPVILGKLF